eukprot:6210393-Pleurochrysis_carterae.AAC.1
MGTDACAECSELRARGALLANLVRLCLELAAADAKGCCMHRHANLSRKTRQPTQQRAYSRCRVAISVHFSAFMQASERLAVRREECPKSLKSPHGEGLRGRQA